MNRRDFFKFLPVAPMVLATEAVAMAHADDAPPDGFGTLVLQNHVKVSPKELPDTFNMPSGMYFGDTFGNTYKKTTVQAAISVGSDGHLWIKPNNSQTWKRVVTE